VLHREPNINSKGDPAGSRLSILCCVCSGLACMAALAHCNELVRQGGVQIAQGRHVNGHGTPLRPPYQNSLEENLICKDNPNSHSLSTQVSENEWTEKKNENWRGRMTVYSPA